VAEHPGGRVGPRRGPLDVRQERTEVVHRVSEHRLVQIEDDDAIAAYQDLARVEVAMGPRARPRCVSERGGQSVGEGGQPGRPRG